MAVHQGMTRTLETARRRNLWPKMEEEIQAVVSACDVCQEAFSRSEAKGKGMAYCPLEIPASRFQRLSIDHVGPLDKTEDGFTYVLTVIDQFTRYLFLIPVRSTTAEETAESLITRVFSVIGCPAQIVSDRGPGFASKLWRDICVELGIRRLLTTPYSPWSNGILERSHRTIKKMLRGFISSCGRNWASLLPWVQLAFNSHTSASTSVPPQLLLLGELPRYPIDWDFLLKNFPDQQLPSKTLSSPTDQDSLLQRLRFNLALAFNKAELSLQRHREKQYERHTQEVSQDKFPSGTLVWIWKPYSLPLSTSAKWNRYWRGPYVVISHPFPAVVSSQFPCLVDQKAILLC